MRHGASLHRGGNKEITLTMAGHICTCTHRGSLPVAKNNAEFSRRLQARDIFRPFSDQTAA